MAEPSVTVQQTANETPIDAVRALAEELTKMIGIALALVVAGRQIDLTGLDSQIGLLCAKTLDLPPEEGRKVRPRLVALFGSAEELARALAKRSPRPS